MLESIGHIKPCALLIVARGAGFDFVSTLGRSDGDHRAFDLGECQQFIHAGAAGIFAADRQK